MSLPTNFFIGRGGAREPVVFDAYGVSEGNISSLSSVTYALNLTNSATLDDGQRTMSSLMLANPQTTSDPKNSRLITSRTYFNGWFRPMAIYPSAASGGWDGVSTSSDISHDATAFNETDNNGNWVEYASLGGAHYTDTTSAQVICRAFQYSQQTSSQYNIYTRYVYKNSSGGYSDGLYQTPVSLSNGGAGSTRFNTDIHSAENSFVQVGKDQDGYASGRTGVSGQPSYIHLRQVTNAGTIGSYHETQYLSQTVGQNTHGHSNRGVFLGAQVQGSTMYSWYFTQYNNWSGGANGYRFVRLRQPTANNSPMAVDVSDHNSKSMNNTDGVLFPASQVYPHAFFTDYDSNAYSSSGAVNGTTYYVDLSQTWSSSTGFTLHSLGVSNKKYYARVGGTTSAPVFAFLSAGYVKIQRFYPSTRTWGSTIASVAIQNSNECNGIWPIPETNRIVVSYQNGIELLEAA